MHAGVNTRLRLGDGELIFIAPAGHRRRYSDITKFAFMAARPQDDAHVVVSVFLKEETHLSGRAVRRPATFAAEWNALNHSLMLLYPGYRRKNLATGLFSTGSILA